MDVIEVIVALIFCDDWVSNYYKETIENLLNIYL